MKNRNIKYSSLFLLLLLFASCKKVTQEWIATKIEGQAIGGLTGMPVEGAKVKIGGSADINGTIKIDEVATLYADANGRFEHKFHAKKDYEYFVTVDKSSECFNAGGKLLKKGKKNQFTLAGIFLGRLIIHLNNQTPFDANDRIVVYNYYRNPPSPSIDITGDNVNMQMPPWVTNYGNTNQPIHWEVTKNGITTNYLDSLYIEPCAENTFSINY